MLTITTRRVTSCHDKQKAHAALYDSLAPQLLQGVVRTTFNCATPDVSRPFCAAHEWMAGGGVSSCDGLVDHVMQAELEPLAAEASIWELLPCALAASMLADIWKSGRWIPSLAAFDNNLHVIVEPICVLTHCVVPNAPQLGPGASDGSDGSDVGGGVDVTLEPFKVFLRITSSILLGMKLRETTDFRDVPLRAMFLLVEAVVELSPLDRCVLEEHIPYCVLHTCATDVALGRQCGADLTGAK